jgi:NADH-quinone oxidoreductase subunit J
MEMTSTTSSIPGVAPSLFYVLAVLAVLSGVLAMTRKNLVHSAIALIVTLLAVAGLCVTLSAPFAAGVQMVAGAGGIGVLFLFALMLVNIRPRINSSSIRPYNARRLSRMWPVGLAAGSGLLVLFLFALVKGKALFPDRMMSLPASSNTQQIGVLLYGEAGRIGQYTFAFEIASLLLVVAILGTVIMTKGKSGN